MHTLTKLFEPANSPPSINQGNKAQAVVKYSTCRRRGGVVALQLIFTLISSPQLVRWDWEKFRCFESWGLVSYRLPISTSHTQGFVICDYSLGDFFFLCWRCWNYEALCASSILFQFSEQRQTLHLWSPIQIYTVLWSIVMTTWHGVIQAKFM